MFTYRASVTRIVDADTLVLDIDLGLRTWLRGKPYRLARVNAPERATVEGKLATTALADLLGPLPASVIVTTIRDRHDAFDRYIVEVIRDGVNVNDWLLANGWAVPYPARGVPPRFEGVPA